MLIEAVKQHKETHFTRKMFWGQATAQWHWAGNILITETACNSTCISSAAPGRVSKLMGKHLAVQKRGGCHYRFFGTCLAFMHP